jgi:hypothetical protein
MRTPLHFKTHDSRYFHAHPLHGTYSLITAMALAILFVLVLVISAR